MSRVSLALLLSVSLLSPLALAKKDKHDDVPPPQQKPMLDIRITTGEQHIYQEWCQQFHDECYGVRQTDLSRLPPGLRKKAEAGGSLPPGWQKKLQTGNRIDSQVYAASRPLPPGVIQQMPPQQPGTVLISIDGKLVRLTEATLTILDIFDIKH